MATISCPDCVTGFVKEGTPTGTVTTVHGLPTYVARPEGNPKALIIIIPDIFGWEMNNARLLADLYAKQGGFLVYLPDFMNGHIPTANTMHTMDKILAPAPILTTIFQKPIWFFSFLTAIIPFLLSNRESTITPKVFTFHQTLRNDPETKGLKIGSAGFCWGGTYTINLCAADSLVDAGFTAHPSPMKFPDAWDRVQKPLSLSIGDVDLAIKIDAVKKIKGLMEEKKPAGQHEVVIIPGAKHGFAIRANPDDEDQTKSAAEATKQALSWFGKWLV